MEKTPSRREFMKAVSALFALSAFDFSTPKRPLPLLSFSTLGCPDWTWDQIVEFASANKYQGIELRGIRRELDLTKRPEFSKQNIRSTMGKLADRKLSIVDLGSSTELHHPPGAERQKHLDSGKQFIDLAEQLKCLYIRVFPNKFPSERDKPDTMELIANGLLELADHARTSGVRVLMETHGDVIYVADIKRIMEMATSPHVGLVWDVHNMWVVTKEPPVDVYAQLKEYIFHTHIKDGKSVDDKLQYTLLGQGDSPIFTAIDALVAGGYRGYFSFEWEKMWHPEIAEPEVALADYPQAMKKHFGG